ncbi:hypothetical protein L484_000607 [Morus notabilis]|uniref:Secreted protein n=1 Tax=Morus notabilis TaxID=981085 RepID=W9RB26_9ROSA|nr:hypothetical protein L484_000607 [Morus notabilis]
MSKSDPKLQVLALFLVNRPLLALEIHPHRLTGPADRSPFHRSTDSVDRSPLHWLTDGVTLLCHRSTGSH